MNNIYNIKSILYWNELHLDRPLHWDWLLYIWNQWWVHVRRVDWNKVTIAPWSIKLSPWDNISLKPLTIDMRNVTFEWDIALRYNDGKPQWSLVDLESLEPLVRVLEFGAKKYERDNWKKPMDKKKILDSLTRHLVRLMADEELDSESWLPHIGHILANAMMYSWHTKWKNNLHNSTQ